MIADFQIEITESEVLRRLGYKKKEGLQGKLKEALLEAIDLGNRLAKPRALYAWFKIKEADAQGLLLEEGSRLNIGRAMKLWKGAEYLAVALCTIGGDLENHASELFSKGEPVLASMLDSVGSVAVDSLEAGVGQLICQQAHEPGMRVGPRLSPGSKDWFLGEQRVLFRLLPAARIGVSLTGHCMMMPRKSLSFCSGAGREVVWKGLDSDKVTNPCQLCGMVNCPYRRRGS